MLIKLIKFFSLVFPMIFMGLEFEPGLHVQIDPQNPQFSSHMRLTGILHGKIPESNLYWVLNPKIYLHPTVPADFSTSLGIKTPASQGMIGYHLFGHFHNFGDRPVNQFGHTVEFIHDRFEARLNYYHPAIAVYPFSSGVKSNHRLESHVSVKNSHLMLTGGPIYHIDASEWGYLGRLTLSNADHDYGMEINQSPGSSVSTAFFINFKFRKPNKYNLVSKENDSSHYTNLSLYGPESYGIKTREWKKSPILNLRESGAEVVE